MTTLNCRPAYGRTYETFAEAKADWEKGLDFRVEFYGYYFSKRDLRDIYEHGYTGVRLGDLGWLDRENG